MNIIKEAEIWFMDNGILPSSVKYNLYTKKEVLKHVQSTAILGVGKNRQGEHIGFAIEVIVGQGVVYGGIIEPCGIATWGKKGLVRAINQNKPLVDVMQDMAKEHAMLYKDESISHYSEVNPKKSEQDVLAITPKKTENTKKQHTEKLEKNVQKDTEQSDNLEMVNFAAQFYFGLTFLIVMMDRAFSLEKSPTLSAVLFGILTIFGIVYVVWMFWTAVKSIYILRQYNKNWGNVAIIAWLFNLSTIVVALFYFKYDIDEEDKRYFEKNFAIVGYFIGFCIWGSLMLPKA